LLVLLVTEFFSLKAKTTSSSSSGVKPEDAVFTSIPSSFERNSISAEATSNSFAI